MHKTVLCWVIVLVTGLAVPVSAELIGYWKLNEGTGAKFLDETDYWHDGTINPGEFKVSGTFFGTCPSAEQRYPAPLVLQGRLWAGRCQDGHGIFSRESQNIYSASPGSGWQ
jgi:hypothetical protein